jgi:hypothetical protein
VVADKRVFRAYSQEQIDRSYQRSFEQVSRVFANEISVDSNGEINLTPKSKFNHCFV